MMKDDWLKIGKPVLDDPWKDIKDNFQAEMLKDIQRSAFEEYYNGSFKNDTITTIKPNGPGEPDYRVPPSSHSHYTLATTREEARRYRDQIERLELENQRRRVNDLEEENLRLRNPALQEAWEQYQIVRKLIKQ